MLDKIAVKAIILFVTNIIIVVPKNRRAPADLLILKTLDNKDNNCFIRTDQLDGETDWKLRKAPGFTQNLTIEEILNLDGFAQYQPPSKLIYNFEGVLNVKDNNNKNVKEALNLENTFLDEHSFSFM